MSSGLTPEERALFEDARQHSYEWKSFPPLRTNDLCNIIDRLLSGATPPQMGMRGIQ